MTIETELLILIGSQVMNLAALVYLRMAIKKQKQGPGRVKHLPLAHCHDINPSQRPEKGICS